MIAMSLNEAMTIIEGVDEGIDVNFSGVSIDSRNLSPGELFVAIEGPNFDGHDFIDAAHQRGAVAAMVSKPVDTSLPVLKVTDTRKALSALSKDWRQRYNGSLIAITGSNGKTTVKEMLAAILRQRHRVLVTKGNLNNDLGVPLTLLGLSDDDDYAVIELGANHLSEIEGLSLLVEPDVALITNIGAAHLEGFGSMNNIAKAKSEIFRGLKDKGIAVLNRDDAYYDYLASQASAYREIRFGEHEQANVRLLIDTLVISTMEPGEWLTHFDVVTPQGVVSIELALAGRHNVQNAVAAIAVACAVNIPLADIAGGLAVMLPVAGRMQIKKGIGDWSVIDDTYNANPVSLHAAIDMLATLPGAKIVVMGDMAELGDDAIALHEQIGRVAREQGVNSFYGVGPLSAHAVKAFGEGAKHCATQLELVNELIADLHSDCTCQANTILVKGSRSAGMERVVDALVAGKGAVASTISKDMAG